MQVSVHVLGQRGPEAAIACLRHVQTRLPAGVRIRFLGEEAREGTAAAVAAALPSVEVWPVACRQGFAGAHNRGLRRAFSAAGDDAVLMLSEDARPTHGFLPPLLEVMKWRPRSALVSPKILLPGEPQRIWYAGGRIDWWRGLATQPGAGQADDGRFDRPGPTDFATAIAMLVRSQAFDRAGQMDESYLNWLHDVDWSVRARRVGMEIHYQPRSRVHYAAPASALGEPCRDLSEAAADLLAEERAQQRPRSSRLRLVAHHGRWYHWSAASARLAAEATHELLSGRRRRPMPPIAPSS